MQSGFLAMGDSYTVGEGVSGDASWPVQLAARLRVGGIDLGEPQIVAATGWTTDELSAAMDAALLAPPYALVTLSVGVNNQYRGQPLDGFRAQFRTLLQRAVALAGGDASHVVAVSIPDWGVTPFARAKGRDAEQIAREIDAFNGATRVEAGNAGTGWADVVAISREPEACMQLVADGLHPSREQYARWVDAIEPVARIALRAG